MTIVQDHPRKVLTAGAIAAILAASTPLVTRWEGEIPATYLDPLKIITACLGHTDPSLRMGMRFTHGQCMALLDKDQRAVLRGVDRCTTVDMSPLSYGAFVSFSFNTGYGVYCDRFAAMVNRGDLAAACRRMGLYVYGRDRVTSKMVKLPGLVRRRTDEIALCLKGVGV